jgi:hypothetical protein
MSTRGAVAAGTLKRWRGVYNHYDSYPTGLGKDLYEHLIDVRNSGKSLAEIGEDILRFDDWRNYLKGGVCEYCGRMTGQAHSISGMLFLEKKAEPYPDPEAKHHAHNSLANVRRQQYTNRSVRNSDLEWVYIINPDEDVIHVLSVRSPQWHVGDMRFDRAPDFQALECGENFERCKHYAWYHFLEIDRDGPQERLGTKHYLGILPLREFDEVYAFRIHGQRYTRTGSGVHGRYAHHRGISASDPDAWYEEVVSRNGKCSYRPVARIMGETRLPYPGVTWIFPPTLICPRETTRTQ